MLSGGMGGRAIQFFTDLGIQPATGAAGTVAESIGAFLDGLVRDAEPCDHSVEHAHG
jgi:predicted Fe-Mo cluster-binding NifX family protein